MNVLTSLICLSILAQHGVLNASREGSNANASIEIIREGGFCVGRTGVRTWGILTRMMHINYKLGRSNKHGIGLFTDEDIAQGTLIYTESPLLDVNITQEQFDSLSDNEKKEILWWGFKDEHTNLWHVDFDVTKFINHSFDANISQDDSHKEAYLVTTKDIKKGEEITQNYLEFETEEDLKRRGILPE